MMNNEKALVAAVVAVLVLLWVGPTAEALAGCNVKQLTVCYMSAKFGFKPTALCCHKIRKHQQCICDYVKQLNLKEFPYLVQLGFACGIRRPTC